MNPWWHHKLDPEVVEKFAKVICLNNRRLCRSGPQLTCMGVNCHGARIIPAKVQGQAAIV
jgi:hypothetical protein